ncbi:hypothetical protein LSTR_LSTR008432 [Laodelphax striatellus]|uniref:Uncharacterized protein n=1 Tax=Laodelphax striatellus TaxID=195883 RepID=A0A482XTI2_LAOST|nr:hypothetical protein LSTR_LSTR008432 [Laodelphax striatellus]
MCCFLPRLKSSFCWQLNIVAGFLVMLIFSTIFSTLRFINMFSKECTFRGNGTSPTEDGKGKNYTNGIVKELQITLPLVECCDKYFNSTVWNIWHIIMFLLCLFLLFTFCYLSDPILLVALGAFMLACVVNIIFQIIALVGPIMEDSRNKNVCYMENVIIIVFYLYMTFILNSYYFMVDDNRAV